MREKGKMKRYAAVAISAFLLLLAPLGALAEQGSAEPDREDAKELSGMSIVGNDDAPKSLYIVPWKGSELGAEITLESMLDASAVPVDREVFSRQLDYYRIRNGIEPQAR